MQNSETKNINTLYDFLDVAASKGLLQNMNKLSKDQEKEILKYLPFNSNDYPLFLPTRAQRMNRNVTTLEKYLV